MHFTIEFIKNITQIPYNRSNYNCIIKEYLPNSNNVYNQHINVLMMLFVCTRNKFVYDIQYIFFVIYKSVDFFRIYLFTYETFIF